MIQLPNGLVWACPDCLGDMDWTPHRESIRCISCGRTLDEIAALLPPRKGKTFFPLRFPDDRYARGQSDFDGDPSWPPAIDPS